MSALPTIEHDELAAEAALLLPPRETLGCKVGCVNVATVVGVNLAIAVNAASVNSSAYALAMQYLAASQR